MSTGRDLNEETFPSGFLTKALVFLRRTFELYKSPPVLLSLGLDPSLTLVIRFDAA